MAKFQFFVNYIRLETDVKKLLKIAGGFDRLIRVNASGSTTHPTPIRNGDEFSHNKYVICMIRCYDLGHEEAISKYCPDLRRFIRQHKSPDITLLLHYINTDTSNSIGILLTRFLLLFNELDVDPIVLYDDLYKKIKECPKNERVCYMLSMMHKEEFTIRKKDLTYYTEKYEETIKRVRITITDYTMYGKKTTTGTVYKTAISLHLSLKYAIMCKNKTGNNIILDIFYKFKFTYNYPKFIEQIHYIPPKVLKKLPSHVQCIHMLLNKKVDLLKLHYDYTEKGVGFEEAKKDFIKQIVRK